jgi:DNA-binding HxlR family transcriptional regulator
MFLKVQPKKSSTSTPRGMAHGMPSVAGMVENIVGCKWSLSVIALVRDGVNRPGAMEHAIPGLSAKVLNERLRKLQRFGILDKRAYPEIPPRVEYSLTPFGARFVGILDQIAALDAQMDRGSERARATTTRR